MRQWFGVALAPIAMASAMQFNSAQAEEMVQTATTDAPAAMDYADSSYVPSVALHGSPKYAPDFEYLDYVNPDAPKGGDITLSAFGSYDSLNGFILKGSPAVGLGLIYQSLTTQPSDEAFTIYGSLAEAIAIPEDKSYVRFRLRDGAVWHDGKPVTVEDVIFSLNIIKEKGHPFYRSYYGDVTEAIEVGEREVQFNFSKVGNAELPLIMGQLTILPKHYWQDKDFGATTLEAPLGSGPYRITEVDAGRSIRYERVKDWWAADLPIFKGQYNYDQITFEYYRDAQVMLEAFKAGEFDLRQENTAKDWAQSYAIPAVESGRIQRDEIAHSSPQGMQAFVFNTRKSIFADVKTRQALALMLDFEWLNKNIFFDQYVRTSSFFSNSELASSGLPTAEELALLEPFRDQLPASVFDSAFELPKTNASGNIRPQLRKALKLLKQAGWVQKDGALVHKETGETLSFEILLVSPTMERVAQPYVRNLEKLGITASIRVVDSAQYRNLLDNYQFDMIVGSFRQSSSPGNEQRDFWGSTAADTNGGRNLAGIKDPVIDALIETVIHSESRDDLITATHALDRVLLSGWYVVPQWHLSYYRVAWWDKFGRPAVNPPYGFPYLNTWWVDPAKASALSEGN